LQIQDKIPEGDIRLGLGVQHTNNGKGLDTKVLNEIVAAELLLSEDVSVDISIALEIESQFMLLKTDSNEFNFMKRIVFNFELNQRVMEEHLNDKSMFQSEKEATQMELDKLRIELEEIVQENCRLSAFVGSSPKLEERLQDAENQLTAIAHISVQAQEKLLGEIEFLKAQSRRPSYNFSLLISNIFPAIKIRLRKLFD
jgi:hypothetical protein